MGVLVDFKADLHCHSTYSDGSLHPKALLELALANGLQGISITDHDTVEAYLDNELFTSPVHVIPGAEFTTTHRGSRIHALAYSFSLNDPRILDLSKVHKIRRDERIREMAALLRKEGFDIDIEKILEKVKMPGRPHLAMALLEKGVVKDLKEAFDKYIGDEKKCFVKSHAISTEETLAILKKAKAIPVIAHPHLIKENKVVKDLLKMDFEGIEVFYANFQKSSCEKWLRFAQNKKWLATGGSDFHGDSKTYIALGASYTPKETFQKLMTRYEENKLS